MDKNSTKIKEVAGGAQVEADGACHHKTKKRGDGEYKSLINRLSRIEGQVRGIRKMVENDAYCTDIIIQVSAVTSALSAFNKELLSNHIKTCVAEDIKNGDGTVVEDLLKTLERIMK